MKASQRLLLAALTACVANAWGQTTERAPHIGYLYPAGGQQGTVVQVLVGGQAIRGASQVYVSGEGVHATVVRTWQPLRPLNRGQMQEIQKRMDELQGREQAALFLEDPSRTPPRKGAAAPALDKPAYGKKKAAAAQGANGTAGGKANGAASQPANATAFAKKNAAIPLGGNKPAFAKAAQGANALAGPGGDKPAAQGANKPAAQGAGKFAFAKKNQAASQPANNLAGATREAAATPGANQAAFAKGKGVAAPSANKIAFAKGSPAASQPASSPAAAKKSTVRDQPILDALENLSPRELQYLAAECIPNEMRQNNAQIAETALIEITIDPGAAPGDREMRLGSGAGLTNPMRFQVGQLPEVCEQEGIGSAAVETPPVDLPVTLNGQIMPGDVDRFRIRARRGQHLVLRAQARTLVPYLADAVPGWFQATLALYDPAGKEVAYDDDYRFDPDPVLYYEIPEDGVYTVEIHDSIYRGREDFVYRVAVGELPFITGMYPLGGKSGVATAASIVGWNLPGDQLPLDTQPGGGRIRQTALRQGPWLSNRVPYAVDSLPECSETEPNDSVSAAQTITLPQIINGRIERPGDVDIFRFDGRAGDEVVAEVYARRLNSPLDSALRLTDASGRLLKWNDDHEDKATGLLTHHADSYLTARLTEDGAHYVELADAQRHGDPSFSYRLRVAPPRPDFELRLAPSSLSVPTGRNVPIAVYAVRRDGFNGDIELALKDAPAGFRLSGPRIPAGRDMVRMTLTAPGEPLDRPIALRLEGRAEIGGKAIVRPAVPAEDMMQAFAYRHLAPSQQLLVAVVGKRYGSAPLELADAVPIRVPAGGAAQVRLNTPRNQMPRNLQLELSDPPKGVTLQDVSVQPSGLAFVLKADGKAAKAGLADNLIVQAFTEPSSKAPAKAVGVAKQAPKRQSLGVLPAIPFEIVQE
ncbi:MAG: hypothetical protein NTW86_22035 [Candidatus Sumerlaeota bacterium]|nr:hypothetical protein [Candidatus Sumerlaeota bacterium]